MGGAYAPKTGTIYFNQFIRGVTKNYMKTSNIQTNKAIFVFRKLKAQWFWTVNFFFSASWIGPNIEPLQRKRAVISSNKLIEYNGFKILIALFTGKLSAEPINLGMMSWVWRELGRIIFFSTKNLGYSFISYIVFLFFFLKKHFAEDYLYF